MKRIILVNLNGQKLNFKLSLRSKAKEGRTHLLNANNPPGKKDPAMGINGFEGVGPEWLLP